MKASEIALIRAGLVAAYGLGADIDSRIIFVPPEIHHYIVTDHPNYNMDCVELRKWTNGVDSFHIGYSAEQKTIVLSFSEAL